MNLHPTLQLLLLVVPVVSQSPFDDLMKCAQAGASSDQCTSTSMADGESCVFCTSPSLGQSVCTTPQFSDAAKQFLPDLDCGDSMNEEQQEEDEESSTTGGLDDPFSDILLCAQQSGDENQCTSTETSDGTDCVYCTSDSVQQPVCTTESASQMMKQLLPDLDCGGDVNTNTDFKEKEEREEEKMQPSLRDNIQDLLLCVQSGASAHQCTSAEMSDGEHCVFCKSSSVKQDVCTTPVSVCILFYIFDVMCMFHVDVCVGCRAF